MNIFECFDVLDDVDLCKSCIHKFEENECEKYNPKYEDCPDLKLIEAIDTIWNLLVKNNLIPNEE